MIYLVPGLQMSVYFSACELIFKPIAPLSNPFDFQAIDDMDQAQSVAVHSSPMLRQIFVTSASGLCLRVKNYFLRLKVLREHRYSSANER